MNVVKRHYNGIHIKMAAVLIILLLLFAVFNTRISAASQADSDGGWKKNDRGWWYESQDGTYPAGQWSKIESRWYYFGASGYMQHGWKKVDGRWYYLGSPDNDDSGAMRHGWLKDNDKWYYLGSPDNDDSGAMRHGWFKDNDKWYYLGSPNDDESGAMATGWREIDGKWYYFSESGAMRHGWFKDNDNWYYLGSPNDDESGSMATCWREIDGKWYYFSESGAMITGVVDPNNGEGSPKYYYLGEDGAWLETCKALSVDGTDYVIIKGLAYEVMTESDRTLYLAMDVLTSITTDDMTDEEKLQASFDYVKSVPEFNTRVPHYTGTDWPIVYANDIFIGTGDGRTGTKGGNCFSIAAAFAYLARAIGYEEVYSCHDTGHGFVEIDGLVYDPEWSKTHFQYTFYGIPFDTKVELQNYALVLTASEDNPYMRVKVTIN
ncbi:MAG: N-acetylmuramoyl-L-alanine amidase family protein [Firmicutes bacterium]|nr:N-acetylmuramoyl-L-alanine amidase family protein [Bacillota bacterium]